MFTTSLTLVLDESELPSLFSLTSSFSSHALAHLSCSASSVNGGQAEAILQNKGYQNDALNPYFMHPNENPGNVLFTPILSGFNYHSWSRAMTMALRSKHKLHFVNGALPRPHDDDRDSIAWDRCNTMIM
ncbi:hypothetical protein L195_g022723 [Trifolium pratense]|uniref:Retrotransposon Copia-like N-terminal domain-containing protein n=1 Tax=Trifolium pratense TaxID=57577 RepID=A0A2K3N8U8_TRIPR|nr:hypothetical protein L195_g022723 [Trifolium pratense]